MCVYVLRATAKYTEWVKVGNGSWPYGAPAEVCLMVSLLYEVGPMEIDNTAYARERAANGRRLQDWRIRV